MAVLECLDNAVNLICDQLSTSPQCSPFLTATSLPQFKGQLLDWISRGVSNLDAMSGDSIALRHADPKDVEGLVNLILDAFRKPISLGDDILDSVMRHLDGTLMDNQRKRQVFAQLWECLIKQGITAPAQKAASPLVVPTKAATAPRGSTSPTMLGNDSLKAAALAIPDVQDSKETSSNASLATRPLPPDLASKVPDVSDIIASARKFSLALDVDDVIAVQKMVSTDVGEVLKLARSLGYEDMKIQPEPVKAMQLLWKLFCRKQGSIEAAEAAVCRKLRKVDPGMAVLLYGARGQGAEIDPSTGRRRKRAEDGSTRTQEDVAEIMAACTGSSQKAKHGMEGLINALLGELDEDAMALDFFSKLDADEQETVLTKAAERVDKEHASSRPQPGTPKASSNTRRRSSDP